MDFNPRSYKRSDQQTGEPTDALRKFQSTLLQEERLCIGNDIINEIFISIHAPTRGATANRSQQLPFCFISIHAPTRGATETKVFQKSIAVFQSTLLQEERLEVKIYTLPDGTISIHAPTRGATAVLVACRLLPEYFNPRSYKRSDYKRRNLSAALSISIHAPTRGATKVCCQPIPVHIISIHAPTRGATFTSNERVWCIFDFNPRSYKRSDLEHCKICMGTLYFNPRSYKRSDNSEIIGKT